MATRVFLVKVNLFVSSISRASASLHKHTENEKQGIRAEQTPNPYKCFSSQDLRPRHNCSQWNRSNISEQSTQLAEQLNRTHNRRLRKRERERERKALRHCRKIMVITRACSRMSLLAADDGENGSFSRNGKDISINRTPTWIHAQCDSQCVSFKENYRATVAW